MRLSIIIPVLNEEETLAPLIAYLTERAPDAEVIVVDGGSTDHTLRTIEGSNAKIVHSKTACRSVQMNEGASVATGSIYYFVHADTLPPATFLQDIETAVQQGYSIGRYRTRFDSRKWYLKINAWFTRFDWFICMGGDQTLFVTRQLFIAIAGFREELRIMEEYEFCVRARKTARYMIFNDATLVSARKYKGRSWLKVQLANRKAVRLYQQGASQDRIFSTYQKMLQ